jgi:hypothetical protein
MFIVTLTAAITGISEIVNNNELPGPPKAHNNAGEVATLVSSMLFSFEESGLVLPVEKSFVVAESSSLSSREVANTSWANYQYRSRLNTVLVSCSGPWSWSGHRFYSLDFLPAGAFRIASQGALWLI